MPELVAKFFTSLDEVTAADVSGCIDFASQFMPGFTNEFKEMTQEQLKKYILAASFDSNGNFDQNKFNEVGSYSIQKLKLLILFERVEITPARVEKLEAISDVINKQPEKKGIENFISLVADAAATTEKLNENIMYLEQKKCFDEIYNEAYTLSSQRIGFGNHAAHRSKDLEQLKLTLVDLAKNFHSIPVTDRDAQAKRADLILSVKNVLCILSQPQRFRNLVEKFKALRGDDLATQKLVSILEKAFSSATTSERCENIISLLEQKIKKLQQAAAQKTTANSVNETECSPPIENQKSKVSTQPFDLLKMVEKNQTANETKKTAADSVKKIEDSAPSENQESDYQKRGFDFQIQETEALLQKQCLALSKKWRDNMHKQLISLQNKFDQLRPNEANEVAQRHAIAHRVAKLHQHIEFCLQIRTAENYILKPEQPKDVKEKGKKYLDSLVNAFDAEKDVEKRGAVLAATKSTNAYLLAQKAADEAEKIADEAKITASKARNAAKNSNNNHAVREANEATFLAEQARKEKKAKQKAVETAKQTLLDTTRELNYVSFGSEVIQKMSTFIGAVMLAVGLAVVAPAPPLGVTVAAGGATVIWLSHNKGKQESVHKLAVATFFPPPSQSKSSGSQPPQHTERNEEKKPKLH